MITAGVYESEIADAVNSAFEEKQGMPYKEALEAVAAELNLLERTVIWRFPMCMEIPGLAATVCSLT